MKKIYQQPVTETVEIKGSELMDNGISFGDNGQGSVTTQEEEGDGPVMSRGYDWDE